MRFSGILGFLAGLCVLFLGGLANAETLVLGSVNDNVRKHLDRFAPLSAYLEAELADFGIDKVEISVLPSSETMAAAMQNGEVDLYFDSPLVAAKVARASGAAPFLRRWKRGTATYHSVIIVPQESEIEMLQDLPGLRIGFQEPDSTSGFLLPAGLLRSEGLSLQELENRQDKPSPEDIGYVFTGDDKNTLTWLLKGWIDAAATDPNGFQTLNNAKPGQFREIARSVTVPRQVVIRRSNLDADLLVQISRVLMSMHETETGREIMAKFHKTSKFDQFPEGADETFGRIYEILDQLETMGIL